MLGLEPMSNWVGCKKGSIADLGIVHRLHCCSPLKEGCFDSVEWAEVVEGGNVAK